MPALTLGHATRLIAPRDPRMCVADGNRLGRPGGYCRDSLYLAYYRTMECPVVGRCLFRRPSNQAARPRVGLVGTKE